GITPCELALSDPSYRFVALGKVHSFSIATRVHTNPIPDGYVRVNIDYVIEENTPLSIPVEGECHVINDAIGTLVLWPIELVVLEKTINFSTRRWIPQKIKIKKVDHSTSQHHLFISRKRLSDKPYEVAHTAYHDKEGESDKTPTPSFMESQKVANSMRNQDEHDDILIKTPLSCDIEAQKCIKKMDCNEQIIIPIDIGIITQSKTVHVGKEEILRFLAHEQIGVCHILIHMTKMYEYASMTGVSSLFGFLCPSGLSLMTQHQKGDVKKVKENKRNRSRYLVDVFKENVLKGKEFFAPYNDGSQWILCSVDPYNNIVYYLDSLHNQEDIGAGKGKAEDGHKMDNNT
ncbi:GTP cyclohydrolase FolE2, partial [Bienertia sinuspersici]